MAQYLDVGFVDPATIHAATRRSSPRRTGVPMRDRSRALFPVEQAHGRGIYDRGRLLPDPPAFRVQMGRFMKHQRLGGAGALHARGGGGRAGVLPLS